MAAKEILLKKYVTRASRLDDSYHAGTVQAAARTFRERPIFAVAQNGAEIHVTVLHA
jgi:hypothetical protein